MERETMNPRKYLCILLPLLTLWVTGLAGCATPDVICGMRIDYAGDAIHKPALMKTGNARLAWRFESEMPDRTYGLTNCYATDGDRLCLLRLKGPPPKFSDVCGLAKFGHEVAHAMQEN